jgi:hypothetical protein
VRGGPARVSRKGGRVRRVGVMGTVWRPRPTSAARRRVHDVGCGTPPCDTLRPPRCVPQSRLHCRYGPGRSAEGKPRDARALQRRNASQQPPVLAAHGGNSAATCRYPACRSGSQAQRRPGSRARQCRGPHEPNTGLWAGNEGRRPS